MPSFSQSFLASLGQPRFAQGMFDVGQAIGGIGGQLAEKKRREAEAQELAGLSPNSAEYLRQVARQYEARGNREMAIKYDALADQAKRQEAIIGASQGMFSGDLEAGRKAAQTFAGLGMTREAGAAEQRVKEEEVNRGKTALARYMQSISAKGEDLTSLKVKEGFDRIAGVYGVPFEEAGSMYEAAIPKEKLTPSKKADLISNGFDPKNVEKYSQTGDSSDLGASSEDVREGMTSFEKTMLAAGVEKDSDEWRRFSRLRAELLINPQTTGLNSAEQIKLLSDVLREDPSWENHNKVTSQARKLLATLEAIRERRKKGQAASELQRVAERTASELYNSDSRAASEINRYLEGKGIKRQLGDWLGGVFAGELTEETLGAIEATANTAQKFHTKEGKRIIDVTLEMYKDSVSEGATKAVRNRFMSNFEQAPTVNNDPLELF
jgi:hypothetical protein